VAGGMRQRHEHLTLPLLGAADVVLHDCDPALVAQPLDQPAPNF